jgi:hypothetical protein
MSSTPTPTPGPDQASVYQIRIGGHLDLRWGAWFDHLAVTPEADGTTLLTGPVIDQAALHGLLRKVRDLGLPLLSITRVEPGHDDLTTTTWKDTP